MYADSGPMLIISTIRFTNLHNFIKKFMKNDLIKLVVNHLYFEFRRGIVNGGYQTYKVEKKIKSIDEVYN